MARSFRLLFFSGLVAASVMTLAAFAAAPSFDLISALAYVDLMAREVAVIDANTAMLLASVAGIIALARPSPARVRAFTERLMNRPDYIGDGSTT